MCCRSFDGCGSTSHAPRLVLFCGLFKTLRGSWFFGSGKNICGLGFFMLLRLGSSVVERQPCKLLAAGSTPARGSILPVKNNGGVHSHYIECDGEER